MQGLLLFVLPAGRSAEVARPIAQSICDRLWDQGIEPGAATAATRITEGLQSSPLFGNDLHFNDARSLHSSTLPESTREPGRTCSKPRILIAIGPAQRRLLVITCEDIITDLAAHEEDSKVSALLRGRPGPP